MDTKNDMLLKLFFFFNKFLRKYIKYKKEYIFRNVFNLYFMLLIEMVKLNKSKKKNLVKRDWVTIFLFYFFLKYGQHNLK